MKINNLFQVVVIKVGGGGGGGGGGGYVWHQHFDNGIVIHLAYNIVYRDVIVYIRVYNVPIRRYAVLYTYTANYCCTIVYNNPFYTVQNQTM